MIKLLKKSLITVCYAQVREQLRCTRFSVSKQTRGDQKFRDYAHDKRKTLQGTVRLFV